MSRISRRRVLLLSTVLPSAVSASYSENRRDRFRIIGPGGGGAMFNPVISPHDEKTALVSCDMTGAYITRDGGQSWRMFNLRGTVRFFVFDPIDPHTIYAQATGLWRSADHGESWHLISPAPSAIQGIQMSSDHADETIVAPSDPFGRIAALAIDPADSKVLYAAAGKAKPFLFISRDSGASWTSTQSLPEVPLRIWTVPHSREQSPALYLAAPHSLSVIEHGQIRTYPAPAAGALTDASLGIATDGRVIVYSVAGAAGFVYFEDERSWTKCVLPGVGAKVRAIATSLHHGAVGYLSYGDLELDGQIWMGVAKTLDGGKTWELVWKQGKAPNPSVRDAWITETFGYDWGDTPLMLGVEDQNPSHCYGTDLGRTMQTMDGGSTWNAVYSRRVRGNGWQTTGLDVTTSYGIHFDPFAPYRQFITYTDIGLFRSEDGGRSWVSSIHGVPRAWWNTTYWVEFDPDVSNRVWSAHSYTHDLPRPKMWRHTSPGTYRGGICRSDDGGRTWNASNRGMPESAVTHVLLDPSSPRSHRTLYATAFGRGVYKSVDGGLSWALKNQGIEQKDPFAWRLTRCGNGTLYLVVARRSEDGGIGNTGDGALYRSVDGAETWERLALPAGVNGPNGLAADPHTRGRIYLAAWARAVGMHGEGGGIYCSTDGGGSWRKVLQQDQHIYDVTVDIRQPGVLYAAGFESSAWRSTDSGEHWTRIPGFNFKWAHRVIPDPAKPDWIYITTFGGSVWHGPALGAPRVLDIATPELQP